MGTQALDKPVTEVAPDSEMGIPISGTEEESGDPANCESCQWYPCMFLQRLEDLYSEYDPQFGGLLVDFEETATDCRLFEPVGDEGEDEGEDDDSELFDDAPDGTSLVMKQ